MTDLARDGGDAIRIFLVNDHEVLQHLRQARVGMHRRTQAAAYTARLKAGDSEERRV